MTEAWDMRSNIKGKPGSQGTLFQPASKDVLNPQQRWPKGYTPERLNEVRQALRPTHVEHPEHLTAGHGEYEPGDYRGEFGYRAKVEQAIAKSTVPVEHLEHLKEIHGNADERHDATYWPAQRLGSGGVIGIDMTRKNADKDLIHELGHHHDYEHSLEARHKIVPAVAEKHAWQDKSPFHERPTGSGIAMAHNKVQPGVLEATADNYYTEHYRTGGRKSTGDTQGRYERNWTSDNLDRQYPGYTDVRAPKPSSVLHSMQFSNEALLDRDAVRSRGQA